MELHAFDRQRAMPDSHDFTIVRTRGDLELIRDGRRRERVVAPDLERLRQAGKDAAPVVLDEARLPVQQPLRRRDLATERLDDRLMPEADTERRHARVAYQPDQLLRRTARPGGGDEMRRRRVPG